jgi:hypothetical protein
MGLADIIPLIWLLMAGYFGWKRMGRIELVSFVSVTVSFLLAYVVAFQVGPSLAGAKYAVTFPWLLFSLLWTFLWVVFAQIGNKWLSRNAGAHIEMDEYGRPKMGKIWLSKFFGAFWGIVRGALLYVGFVGVSMVLVPTFFYAKGRGTAVVHPNSLSMKALVQHHPELRKLEEVAGGLRVLKHRHKRHVRRQFKKSGEVQRLLRRKDIKALFRQKELLRRANHRRQGRKSATLLLWMPAFQRIFAKPETVAALRLLQKRVDLKKKPRKLRKRTRKRRKKRKR